MTKGMKDQIKGSIFLLVFVGIPLGFVFTPMVTLFFVAGALLGILGEAKKDTTPPKTTRSVKATQLSKEDEELITVIMPTINNKLG